MPSHAQRPLQGRLMPFVGQIHAGIALTANTDTLPPQTGDQTSPKMATLRPAGLSAKLIEASERLDEQQAGLPDDPAPRSPEMLGHLSATPLPEILVTPRPRKQSPWHVSATWRPADRAYLNHHAHCPTCKVAGRRLGNRCSVGGQLWAAYQDAFDNWSAP